MRFGDAHGPKRGPGRAGAITTSAIAGAGTGLDKTLKDTFGVRFVGQGPYPGRLRRAGEQARSWLSLPQ